MILGDWSRETDYTTLDAFTEKIYERFRFGYSEDAYVDFCKSLSLDAGALLTYFRTRIEVVP